MRIRDFLYIVQEIERAGLRVQYNLPNIISLQSESGENSVRFFINDDCTLIIWFRNQKEYRHGFFYQINLDNLVAKIIEAGRRNNEY